MLLDFLNLSAATAKAKRYEWELQVVKELREKNFCISSIRKLGPSLKSLYSNGQKGLLLASGSRETVHTGSRSERGLPELSELASIACCPRGCLKARERSEKIWIRWRGAKNPLERLGVLIECLWVISTDQRSSLCLASLRFMTGASRALLSRLDAALTEFGAERATEIAMAHGNAGRSPSNMTPSNVVTSIMRTVYRYTCHNPETAVLEVVGPDAMHTIAGLASAVEQENPEVAEAVHKKTTENVIRRYLERHGLKAVLVRLTAHNTSPFSEANNGELGILHEKIVSLQQQLDDINVDESRGEDMVELTARLEVFQREYNEIRSVEEHYLLVHYEMQSFICKLQGYAQALDALFIRGGDANGPVDETILELSHPVNSRDGIFMVHIDDMSSVPIPSKKRKGTGIEPTCSASINGCTDYVTEGLHITSLYSSSAYHDTDVVITELWLDILTRVNGQGVLCVVSDQGPLQYNAAIIALCMLLVELGFFTLAIPLYFQLYKSKGPSDRGFGNLQVAVAKEACLGYPHLAHIAEKLFSNNDTKQGMRFKMLNPLSINKLKEWLIARRYNLTPTGSFPASLNFKEAGKPLYLD